MIPFVSNMNAKAINICSVRLLSARNVAGHSGALSAPIRILTSVGYVPGIMARVRIAAPMR